MTILGIDPGVASTGYGVIRCGEKDGVMRLVDYGVITTPPGQILERRLKSIFDGVERIIRDARPDRAATETIFYSKNIKSLVQVSEAIGVVSLAVCRQGLTLSRYTPLEVKQTISGNGKAKKNQIQSMVARMLNLENPPKPDHASDALAVAICEAFMFARL
ncbi:MAG: crossover junction endodeoxyribonuclease RuvC [Spirochaetes bacterium]|nr:crossover junction endodeoxyribonuclease RuvC [Spirochaetota bacterium]